jgi:fructosamine-3-kinase
MPGASSSQGADIWRRTTAARRNCDNFLHNSERIWWLLKRAMANFAAADLDGLVHIVKRKLKKIQYRPHLIDGCLARPARQIRQHCGPERWIVPDRVIRR